MKKLNRDKIISELTSYFNKNLNRTEILLKNPNITYKWFQILKEYNIDEHYHCDTCKTTKNLKKNNKGNLSNICLDCFRKKNIDGKIGKSQKKKVEKLTRCITCGKEFYSIQKNYCSIRCQPSSQLRIKPERECLNCNKKYFYNSKKGESIYFCIDCNKLTIKCKCGCGENIPIKKYFIRNTRYKLGHYRNPTNIKARIKKEEILKRIKAKRPEIQIVSNFNYLDDKIICKSSLCNHTWETKPKYILNGSGCRICRTSKGEIEIKKYLDSESINYIQQFRFKNEGYITKLPFDFYLPDENLCIEYDGEQHFKSVKHWGGDLGLLKRQERDNIKSEFCENNDIFLLRLPYWNQDQIEDSLKMMIYFLKITQNEKNIPDNFYNNITNTIASEYI